MRLLCGDAGAGSRVRLWCVLRFRGGDPSHDHDDCDFMLLTWRVYRCLEMLLDGYCNRDLILRAAIASEVKLNQAGCAEPLE